MSNQVRSQLYTVYLRVADFVAADGDKTRKMSGTASDGEFWVSKALFTIEALAKDVKHVTLLEDVAKDSMTIRTSARHVADTLKQVPVDQGEAAKGAELLLLGSVLHQYIAGGDGIDTDVLEVRIFFLPKNLDADTILGLRQCHDSYVRFW